MRCESLGLVVPMPEQTFLLAGALESLNSGYTDEDFMRLADFVRLGGVGWRKGAWQQISRSFLAELTKALDPSWDGKSDPRLKSFASGPLARDSRTTAKPTTDRTITTHAELMAALDEDAK